LIPVRSSRCCVVSCERRFRRRKWACASRHLRLQLAPACFVRSHSRAPFFMPHQGDRQAFQLPSRRVASWESLLGLACPDAAARTNL
jgi:hypothetical protein